MQGEGRAQGKCINVVLITVTFESAETNRKVAAPSLALRRETSGNTYHPEQSTYAETCGGKNVGSRAFRDQTGQIQNHISQSFPPPTEHVQPDGKNISNTLFIWMMEEKKEMIRFK